MSIRLAACVALIGTGAGADTYQRIVELGTVLAAEELCGLSYSRPAIEALVIEMAPEDDVTFASNLRGEVEVQRYNIDGMFQTAKVAHCRAVENVANRLGIVQQ